MSHEITVESGTSIKLKTAGKYCDRDIVVTATGDTEDLNAVLTEQEALITTLQETLRGKASGGGDDPINKKDVNFYDYDGTLLHSYTIAEAQELTELPSLPEQSGLICQGWNFNLETIKSYNRNMDVGAIYTTDDGTTRIYIHLEEGRTSPMLGIGLNGTATVDWGDGSSPDVLTGTNVSTTQWTQNHDYSAAGDYVIRLTITGSASLKGSRSTNSYSYILRHNSTGNGINNIYNSSVKKIEVGNGVTSIDDSALYYLNSMEYITIPNEVKNIGNYTFAYCTSLKSITIPDGVTYIGTRTFAYCYALRSVYIPDSVTGISDNAFTGNHSLMSITISNRVNRIDSNAFYNCYALESIVIPDGINGLGGYMFYNCHALRSIYISDSVTSLNGYMLVNCRSLSSITIPGGVMTIEPNILNGCMGLRFVNFTKHTAVPALSNANALSGIPEDCEILVPVALYDEWSAATNWSAFADKIRAR